MIWALILIAVPIVALWVAAIMVLRYYDREAERIRNRILGKED